MNSTRILISIGFACVFFSLCGVIFSFIEAGWHSFRFFEIASLTAWLGTLICGIGLLKRRRKIGLILITIWIIVLILWLLIPAMTSATI
jgi:hypothetical protein